MLTSHVEAAQRSLHRQEEEWFVQRLSALDEVRSVIESVLERMADLGFSPREIAGAWLALEEAIGNAIKHRHRHDPAKIVEVRFGIRADHVLFEVEDEGPGFDPLQGADPAAPAILD